MVVLNLTPPIINSLQLQLAASCFIFSLTCNVSSVLIVVKYTHVENALYYTLFCELHFIQ